MDAFTYLIFINKMALTPNEELKLLIKEYKELTGRNIKFDTSSLSNVVSAVKLLKDQIDASKKSVAELVDNFDATLSTLVAAKEELANIDKTVRQALRPEFNSLGKTILGIRNTQKELLMGLVSESKIQRQLNNLMGTRANIEANNSAVAVNSIKLAEPHCNENDDKLKIRVVATATSIFQNFNATK
jgi:hypothetical protein